MKCTINTAELKLAEF